jgi:hypothetical protein
MNVTNGLSSPLGTPWLVFMFMLPSRCASQRVKVWRKLQKYGALPWRQSAYLLPYTHANLEKFHWLAAEIAKHRGQASTLKVARIEGTPDRQIMAMFNAARAKDYERLICDLRLALRAAAGRSRPQLAGTFARLNYRMSEITAIDEFGCGRRKEAETLLKEVERRTRSEPLERNGRAKKASEYRGRVWMTRPRPGVDRVASAWLIRNFIDPKARFVFSSDPNTRAGAVRFDMFEGEFTHVGEDCTFETLLRRFGLRDRRLRLIAQIVHDADLADNKFGRPEGKAIDLVLIGWVKMDWPDQEILRRGFELYDALYLTLGARSSREVQKPFTRGKVAY